MVRDFLSTMFAISIFFDIITKQGLMARLMKIVSTGLVRILINKGARINDLTEMCKILLRSMII